MPRPQAAITNAYENLKHGISEEHANQYALTEMGDVWGAVRTIESRQRKQQAAQNIRRIETLLLKIAQYSGALKVLCSATAHVISYLWVRTYPQLCLVDNLLIESRHRSSLFLR
jgi:hypothetical protein